MRYLALTLALLPLPSLAAPFPGATLVRCQLQSTIDDVEQPAAVLELDVSRLGSCESDFRDFPLPGTPLILAVTYASACQRPGNSFPEHLGSLQVRGPQGSSVYASASTFGGFSSFLSLQLIAKLEGRKHNVLAHCRIERP